MATHAKTLRHSLDKQTMSGLRQVLAKGPFAEKQDKSGLAASKSGSFLASSVSTPQMSGRVSHGPLLNSGGGFHNSSTLVGGTSVPAQAKARE